MEYSNKTNSMVVFKDRVIGYFNDIRMHAPASAENSYYEQFIMKNFVEKELKKVLSASHVKMEFVNEKAVIDEEAIKDLITGLSNQEEVSSFISNILMPLVYVTNNYSNEEMKKVALETNEKHNVTLLEDSIILSEESDLLTIFKDYYQIINGEKVEVCKTPVVKAKTYKNIFSELGTLGQ